MPTTTYVSDLLTAWTARREALFGSDDENDQARAYALGYATDELRAFLSTRSDASYADLLAAFEDELKVAKTEMDRLSADEEDHREPLTAGVDQLEKLVDELRDTVSVHA